MFSCEFCEIPKNTFFIEHLWWLLLDVNDYIKNCQNCQQQRKVFVDSRCTCGSLYAIIDISKSELFIFFPGLKGLKINPRRLLQTLYMKSFADMHAYTKKQVNDRGKEFVNQVAQSLH